MPVQKPMLWCYWAAQTVNLALYDSLQVVMVGDTGDLHPTMMDVAMTTGTTEMIAGTAMYVANSRLWSEHCI